jgi:hypothetical protein
MEGGGSERKVYHWEERKPLRTLLIAFSPSLPSRRTMYVQLAVRKAGEETWQLDVGDISEFPTISAFVLMIRTKSRTLFKHRTLDQLRPLQGSSTSALEGEMEFLTYNNMELCHHPMRVADSMVHIYSKGFVLPPSVYARKGWDATQHEAHQLFQLLQEGKDVPDEVVSTLIPEMNWEAAQLFHRRAWRDSRSSFYLPTASTPLGPPEMSIVRISRRGIKFRSNPLRPFTKPYKVGMRREPTPVALPRQDEWAAWTTSGMRDGIEYPTDVQYRQHKSHYFVTFHDVSPWAGNIPLVNAWCSELDLVSFNTDYGRVIDDYTKVEKEFAAAVRDESKSPPPMTVTGKDPEDPASRDVDMGEAEPAHLLTKWAMNVRDACLAGKAKEKDHIEMLLAVDE